MSDYASQIGTAAAGNFSGGNCSGIDGMAADGLTAIVSPVCTLWAHVTPVEGPSLLLVFTLGLVVGATCAPSLIAGLGRFIRKRD